MLVEIGLDSHIVELRCELVELGIDALGIGHDLVRDTAQPFGDLGLIHVALVHEPAGSTHIQPTGIAPAVVEVEIELLENSPKVSVVGVDERAADVSRDPGLDHAHPRQHSPADPVAGLVDRGLQALLSKLPGGIEPGNAGTDDGDARVPDAAERHRRRQAEAACGERAAEQPAASEPGADTGPFATCAWRSACLRRNVARPFAILDLPRPGARRWIRPPVSGGCEQSVAGPSRPDLFRFQLSQRICCDDPCVLSEQRRPRSSWKA